jgi:uncharacterized protein YndB with AHSA1/START domain
MAEPSPYRAYAEIEIAAAPAKVFDAWLDPGLAARFFAGGDTVVGEIAIDPREGGAFRLVMQDGAARFEHEGRYVVIERPRRLIFTWFSAGTDHRLSLVEVTFTPTAAGVRVRVEHEGLPDAERAGRHQRGWGTILAKLSRLFSAEGVAS